MAYSDPYLLGTLAGMLPIPGIPAKEGVATDYQQSGGLAQTLRGRQVLDVWATRRRFTFAWPMTYAPDARRMIARARGLHVSSLRLLDPTGVNLLPVDVSVCGADEWLAPDATSGSWATPSGGTSSITTDVVMPGGTELSGTVEAATGWFPTAAGQSLYACDAEWQRIPILRRPLTFTAWAFGNVTVTPRIWARTATGGYSGATSGAPVALSYAGWSRLAVTLPAGNTSPGAHVELVAGGAGNVYTTGWQAEHAAAATPWQLGGNAPEVLIAKFTDGYRVLGRRALELELQEV